VFCALTRGPFPSGEPSDATVSAHLATCPSCREFAEALRPIEGIEPESLPEDERYQLPVYLGVELIDAVPWPRGGRVVAAGAFEYGVVERLPCFPGSRRRAAPSRWKKNLARFFSAVLCGALLAMALMGMGLGRAKPQPESDSPTTGIAPASTTTPVLFPLRPRD
jgi:hypothetical protein